MSGYRFFEACRWDQEEWLCAARSLSSTAFAKNRLFSGRKMSVKLTPHETPQLQNLAAEVKREFRIDLTRTQ
jgi:hypothetical protein